MRLRISAHLVMVAATAVLPLSRLVCQASPDVNASVRASAGLAYGDGGNYVARKLAAFSVAMDFAPRRDAGSSPVLGFGFTYYHGSSGSLVQPLGSFEVICITNPCAPPRSSAFPNMGVGYVDIGLRRVSHDFRADAILQPGVAFVGRPDVVPLAIGSSVSIARRLVGAFGIEAGVSGTYLPAFDGARLGLRQVSLGLRSW